MEPFKGRGGINILFMYYYSRSRLVTYSSALAQPISERFVGLSLPQRLSIMRPSPYGSLLYSLLQRQQ